MWKRFRFSLLSLLVGVVLAGGFVCLNVYPTHNKPETLQDDWHGWPLGAYRQIVMHINWPAEYSHLPSRQLRSEWHWPSLAANIAIGFAIVFGGAGVCEFVVRRRAAKVE